ncbi:MAG: hypothetical protein AB7V25_15910, partial [Mangrovibacterium sp.]
FLIPLIQIGKRNPLKGDEKKFQVTGYRLQVSGYRLQVSGFRFQVTGYRWHGAQGIGHGGETGTGERKPNERPDFQVPGFSD